MKDNKVTLIISKDTLFHLMDLLDDDMQHNSGQPLIRRRTAQALKEISDNRKAAEAANQIISHVYYNTAKEEYQ